MSEFNKDVFDLLSKTKREVIPLYCTGYPEYSFIKNYCKEYNLQENVNDFLLKEKNYSIIKRIGFDAISIWDFRRGSGGFNINEGRYVDGWGRIYKNNWYSWDGIFKNEAIVDSWEHLKLPSHEDLNLLKNAVDNFKKVNLFPIFSLPGLFEKTWQSMGLIFFAKCIRKNKFEFIEKVIHYFSNYLITLLKTLQKYRITTYLIADDMGYKNRAFISKSLWIKLFFNQYQEILEIAHQSKKADNKIILHSDGYISDLIDTLIELGFDAIQSLEPDAGVDIFRLFEIYAKRIIFIGNVSNTLLSYGKPVDVKNYIIKLLTSAHKYNAFLIVSPTQQIDSYVNVENVKMMIETTKQFKI